MMLNGKRGVALILVLSMLALISLLGVMSLNLTDSELKLSANRKQSSQAFVAAERAVEYASGNSTILFSTSDTNLNNSPHAANLAVNGSGIDTSAVNMARNLGPGELPEKLRSRYGSEFGANYYLINVTGKGKSDRSRVRVETMRARVYQKEDDSRFITTDGG